MTSSLRSVVLLCSVGLLGCGPLPPPSSDKTPPFLQVIVAGHELTNQDASAKISTSGPQRFSLTINAFDLESGLRSVAFATRDSVDGTGARKAENVEWACQARPPLTGILELGTLPELPSPSPGAAYQLQTTIEPFALVSCGGGVRLLSGFVRVVVTNGVGLTTASKTFLYDN
jgi:hypothetical protein